MFDEFSESSLSLELGSGIIPARLVILPIYYLSLKIKGLRLKANEKRLIINGPANLGDS